MTMIRIINTAGLAEFDLSLEKIHIKCKQEHFFSGGLLELWFVERVDFF